MLHNYLQRGGIISGIRECLGAFCPKKYGQVDDEYDRIRRPIAEELRRIKKYFDNIHEVDYKAYQDSKKLFF